MVRWRRLLSGRIQIRKSQRFAHSSSVLQRKKASDSRQNEIVTDRNTEHSAGQFQRQIIELQLQLFPPREVHCSFTSSLPFCKKNTENKIKIEYAIRTCKKIAILGDALRATGEKSGMGKFYEKGLKNYLKASLIILYVFKQN